MTLAQMSQVRLWHLEHRHHAPLESHAWDGVLTLWLLGWMGVPPALLLHWTWMVLTCVPLSLTPRVYVALRRWLHGRGRLRCDWLAASRPPA